MVKIITSPSNPAVKEVIALSEKARERKQTGLFVVEGRKEVRLALGAGYTLSSLFFFPEVVSFSTLLNELGESLLLVTVYEVGSQVYEKLAYREGTEGVVAVFQSKDHRLENLNLPAAAPFLLIAQAPEKPGNLGALLRTADAAGVDAVLIADPHTDLYNPNIIRSSVGGIFTNTIAVGNSDEIIQFLQSRKIKILCAILSDDATSCYQTDFCGPVAIAVGTESTGLTSVWHGVADAKVIIPMAGKLDSMNVSVSAAILLFEAVRQRRYASE
jgi:TrmH family RNA methyltransferase